MTSLIVGSNSQHLSELIRYLAVYDLVNSGVEQPDTLVLDILPAVYDLVNSGVEQLKYPLRALTDMLCMTSLIVGSNS